MRGELEHHFAKKIVPYTELRDQERANSINKYDISPPTGESRFVLILLLKMRDKIRLYTIM